MFWCVCHGKILKHLHEKKKKKKMDRRMCMENVSLFREKSIFVTMSMPSGYLQNVPIRFQDGSIVSCSGQCKKMRDLLESMEWDIDVVSKIMLQPSTIIDRVNGDSRVKLFRSPQQGLILELYRDRMLALGWSYPPLCRFDIRNRSCWATEFSLLTSEDVGHCMVTSEDVGYWVWFFRSIHDTNFEKHNMTPQKLLQCIEEGQFLEEGGYLDCYEQHVGLDAIMGHPSRRRGAHSEVLFFWNMKLFLRDFAYQFFRIYGNPDEIARVDNNFVMGHLPNIPTFVQTIKSQVELCPNCETVGDFMQHIRRDLPQVPGESWGIHGLKTMLKPFQMEVVEWMSKQEDKPYELFIKLGEEMYYSPLINWWRREPLVLSGGGCLCTEFGMGKTIMCFALFLLHRGSTLVVTTTTLLSQWKRELEEKTNLSVGVFHGANKHRVNVHSHDVVLTTYGMLRSTSSNAPLLEKNWYRIVVDESHHIKNPQSVTAAFLYRLKSEKKWLVSATPIQTRIQDFYGQLKFFNNQLTNYMFQSMFRSREPFQRGNRLSHILQRICHAYTRDQTYGNGEPIVQLPPVHFYQKFVELQGDEREKYHALIPSNLSVDQLSTWELIGVVDKLRRYCSNGSWRSNTSSSSGHSTSIVPNVAEVVDDRQCPICMCDPEAPVITRCGHIYCTECSFQLFRHGSQVTRCPLCRSRIEQSQMRVLVEEQKHEEEEEESPVFLKLIAVMETIKRIRTERPCAKIVVFSQYIQTLKKLMEICPHPICHIQGSTSQKKRALELDRFLHEPDNILFLSMRSGACGINLNNATDVVLVEPAVNEALEDQAIGRVNRMGQLLDVHVHRLVMRSTIEEKIVRIRRREGFVGNLKKDGRLNRNVLTHLFD